MRPFLLREKIIVLVEAYTSLSEGVTAMHARIFLFKRISTCLSELVCKGSKGTTAFDTITVH